MRFEILSKADRPLPAIQQQVQLIRSLVADVHLRIPDVAGEMRQALGIGCVGLVLLRRQRLVRKAGVDSVHRQAQLFQPTVQPDRKLAAFLLAPERDQSLLSKILCDGLRVSRDGRAVLNSALLIHQSDRNLFEGYIEPSILAVLLPAFSCEARAPGPRAPRQSGRRDHTMPYSRQISETTIGRISLGGSVAGPDPARTAIRNQQPSNNSGQQVQHAGATGP